MKRGEIVVVLIIFEGVVCRIWWFSFWVEVRVGLILWKVEV